MQFFGQMAINKAIGTGCQNPAQPGLPFFINDCCNNYIKKELELLAEAGENGLQKTPGLPIVTNVY